MPDIMGQALLLAYEDAFPFSHPHFDAQFKENICSAIFELLIGIVPTELPCSEWTKKQAMAVIKTEDVETQRHNQLSHLLTSRRGADVHIDLENLQVVKQETIKQHSTQKKVHPH